MIDIKLVRKSVYATALELPKRVWDDHSKLVFEALDELDRLQAKDTPMKVANIKQTEDDPFGNRGDIYGDCPVCKTRSINERKFCDECGQRLDWSEKQGGTKNE